MLRSEFLALVPVTLWTAACGDTEPKPIAVAGSGGAGGTHAAPNGSGGVSSQASAESTAGASGSSSGNGGSGAGGRAGPMGGAGASTAQGGSGGASTATVCLGVEASVGAFAFAVDFSPNSETGKQDPHTLLMNRGAMFRQQVDYSTTGDDHTHQVVFTLEQLSALMGGQTVVVETEGPPLNASSGHSHTVTVHPCPAANP